MPGLNLTLKKIIFLKKSDSTDSSLIYLNFQNKKIRWCMGSLSDIYQALDF